MLAAGAALPLVGCTGGTSGKKPDKVWGERGITDGKLQKPRAMCIDQDDLLYLVDITARIQVFDTDGKYLRGWRTPESKNGRPTGMSIIDGWLYVADTHYFRVLVYSLDGQLNDERTFGQEGDGPGDLGWTTDIARDSAGNLYVSEYGKHDRVQKFAPDGTFLLQWGTHGTEPGQFLRPQCLWVDEKDQVWVCDAGNHRLQVFDTEGAFLFTWGEEGIEPGQLSYPYSMWIDHQDQVLVCEYGNSRVQKLTRKGEPVAMWGDVGREPGQLHNPWAIVQDSKKKTYVLDSYNHRVQQFRI
ncbi:Serine/threonine-protein kinase PknD [Aeoliella mucimassa]|uniref:Serine/threonine-protein kinase PknD n=2 Tax=Aeoliella mucimassa TaxID=2527972 RepID=A0A518ASK9_9BACT|nr:Serine/threonine-protein kinase PknD [Aeoliella mucimassa]